jgi:hypothetical protein
MSTRNLPGCKWRPARKAENLIAICELIVYKMWEPRRLKTLWATKACYRDSFTLIRTITYQNDWHPHSHVGSKIFRDFVHSFWANTVISVNFGINQSEPSYCFSVFQMDVPSQSYACIRFFFHPSSWYTDLIVVCIGYLSSTKLTYLWRS